MNKISLCTVSKNRLHHIRETLPVNILDNLEYGNLEFVLLDYNSTDGLEEWVKSNLSDHIHSGVLKYFKTTEPLYFNIAHSKNMAIKLSTGDVVGIIDADNFAGPGYANWINGVFIQNGENTLVTAGQVDGLQTGDLGGKIAFHRDLVRTVRGFDESMVGYGMDDVDFLHRLESAGGIKVSIEKQDHLQFISHTIEDRLKNYSFINTLSSIYINLSHTSQTEGEVVFLMKNQSYRAVTFTFDDALRANKAMSFDGWYIKPDAYKNGKTVKIPKGVSFADKSRRFYPGEHGQVISYNNRNKRSLWKKVSKDSPIYMNLIITYSDCMNRLKFHVNNNSATPVNADGWGKGKVYLNFDYNNPIYIET